MSQIIKMKFNNTLKTVQDFLTVHDLDVAQLQEIMAIAAVQKSQSSPSDALKDKHFGIIFEKPSLRTRFSFEVGIKKLSGHSLYYDMQNERLGERESLKDFAINLSQFVDGLIIRNHDHLALQTVAQYAQVPVINALCNLHHPCQALADWLTLKENHSTVSDLHMVYVGDGNNVCHSLMQMASRVGPNLTIVTPEAYGPCETLLHEAKTIAARNNINIALTHNLDEVKDVDVVYTDAWLSMGETSKQKEAAFKGLQVNSALMQKLKAKWFLHCQPMHRGKEVCDAVADDSASLVYQQTANRMYAQNALLTYLFK